MFGNKKKAARIRRMKFATLIAHDVHLAGDLEFSEGLRLDGHLQGNVRAKAGNPTLLVLSDLGSITGNVHGHDLVINGKVTGDVVAEHFVELQASAHVTGNIDYRQLRIEPGATVDGKLTRREPPAASVPVAAIERGTRQDGAKGQDLAAGKPA